MADYRKQLQIEKTEILRKHLNELPDFCVQFFRGTENRTSILTRIAYANDLKIFFNFLLLKITAFKNMSIKDITIDHLKNLNVSTIESYVEYLNHYTNEHGEKVNTETGKSRKLACLRSFFQYYVKKEYLDKNVASLVDMPKLHQKDIVKLDADEVALFLDNVESGNNLSEKQKSYHDKTFVRDLALVTLFLSTGIRISELVGLNINDIDFKNNSFSIVRKGGDTATLFFADEAKDALFAYISQRKDIKTIDEKDADALFLSMQKKRISPRAVQQLVKKYAKTTVPLKKISPHKLRSTFGTMLYNETGDIYLVADVLGHKDVNTTKKHYVSQKEERKKYAARQIKLREDD